jgi:hypothetical protein
MDDDANNNNNNIDVPPAVVNPNSSQLFPLSKKYTPLQFSKDVKKNKEHEEVGFESSPLSPLWRITTITLSEAVNHGLFSHLPPDHDEVISNEGVAVDENVRVPVFQMLKMSPSIRVNEIWAFLKDPNSPLDTQSSVYNRPIPPSVNPHFGDKKNGNAVAVLPLISQLSSFDTNEYSKPIILGSRIKMTIHKISQNMMVGVPREPGANEAYRSAVIPPAPLDPAGEGAAPQAPVVGEPIAPNQDQLLTDCFDRANIAIAVLFGPNQGLERDYVALKVFGEVELVGSAYEWSRAALTEFTRDSERVLSMLHMMHAKTRAEVHALMRDDEEVTNFSAYFYQRCVDAIHMPPALSGLYWWKGKKSSVVCNPNPRKTAMFCFQASGLDPEADEEDEGLGLGIMLGDDDIEKLRALSWCITRGVLVPDTSANAVAGALVEEPKLQLLVDWKIVASRYSKTEDKKAKNNINYVPPLAIEVSPNFMTAKLNKTAVLAVSGVTLSRIGTQVHSLTLNECTAIANKLFTLLDHQKKEDVARHDRYISISQILSKKRKRTKKRVTKQKLRADNLALREKLKKARTQVLDGLKIRVTAHQIGKWAVDIAGAENVASRLTDADRLTTIILPHLFGTAEDEDDDDDNLGGVDDEPDNSSDSE